MAKDRTPPMQQAPISCDDVSACLAADAATPIPAAQWHWIDAHLQHCKSCARLLEDEGRLVTLLREDARHDTASAGLWAKIVSNLDEEHEASRHAWASAARMGLQGRWPVIANLAAAAVIVVAVLVAQTGIWPSGGHQPAVVTESINDFITFRLSGRTPDIEGSDFRRLAGWLAPRVDFSLPRNLRTPPGFHLTGGRLCSFLSRRLVSYMFEKGDAAASLYIMSGVQPDDLQGPWQEVADDIHRFRVQGLSSLVWKRDSLVFALVSDLSDEELMSFFHAMHGGMRADGEIVDPIIIRSTHRHPPNNRSRKQRRLLLS